MKIRNQKRIWISAILCVLMLLTTVPTFAGTDEMPQEQITSEKSKQLLQGGKFILVDEAGVPTLEEEQLQEEEPQAPIENEEPEHEKNDQVIEEEDSNNSKVTPEAITPVPNTTSEAIDVNVSSEAIEPVQNVSPEALEIQPFIAKPALTAFYIKSIKSVDPMTQEKKAYQDFPKVSNVPELVIDYTKNKYDRENTIVTVRVDGCTYNGESYTLDNQVSACKGQGWYDVTLKDGATAGFSEDIKLVVTDTDAPTSTFKLFGMDSKSDFHYVDRRLVIKWDDDRSAAPESPEFVYDASKDKYILTGVDSTMEYRKTGAASENQWSACTDQPMLFNAPVKEENYYVRYKAANGRQESQSKPIKLIALRFAPSVTLNPTTEMLSGLTTEMEMKFNDGNYFDVTEEIIAQGVSSFIDQVEKGQTANLMIRLKADSEHSASKETVIPLNSRLDQPTTVVYENVTFLIRGLSTDMQYKLSTDTAWLPLSSPIINAENYASAEKDVDILIRMKPTQKNAASKPVVVTIPKLAAAPLGKLDYAKEIITGLDPTASYQYKIGTGYWINLKNENGNFNISSFVASSEKVIYIRKIGSAADVPSAGAPYVLPARKRAPRGPVFSYNNAEHAEKAVLKGVMPDMEYRHATDATWTTGTGNDIIFDIPNLSQTFYIRYKVTDTDFASSNVGLILYPRANAPGVTYNATKEEITALNNSLEWSFDGQAYELVNVTTYDTSSKIDALKTGQIQINIRWKATETKPASQPKTITLFPRAATPNTLKYNAPKFTIEGVSNAMQYKSTEESAWNNISANTLNVEKYASEVNDVNILVRMKPSATYSASKTTLITIPKLVNAPTGTLNYQLESITGLDVNAAYQYRTAATGAWNTGANNNGKFVISNFITSSDRVIYFRKASTADKPATAQTAFTIPKRPANAPSLVEIIYNDPGHAEQAVLRGVTADMEYKMATDTAWISGTGKNIILSLPTSSQRYYIRNKATDAMFASNNKELILYNKAVAPGAVYNSTTEQFTSLNTAMEWRFNEEAYQPITQTTYDLSTRIDALNAGQQLIINIRNSATATKPSTREKTFIIYPRLAAPTTVVYDKTSKALTGVNNTMQYRAKGTVNWSAISSTTVSMTTLLNKGCDKVEVRCKPTAQNSASKIVEIQL